MKAASQVASEQETVTGDASVVGQPGLHRAPAQIPCEHRGGRIAAIASGSPAAAAGLRPGDRLVAINGHPIQDVLDYQFYAADDQLSLLLRRGSAELTVGLRGDEALGIDFDEATFDGIRLCKNRCPFCFVKHLPKGMRRSLYVKDDDYRYSLRYGSFVTLTNLTENDWARLAEQRLSPLRVSVHTTDLALRRAMLGNPNAPDVLGQLRRMADLGLRVHVQLVLCPGINDGEHFARSVADLSALHPAVQSIAAVPVGLTRYSRDPRLRQFTPLEAKEIVTAATRWQRALRQRVGSSVVHLGDELYFLAGLPFPGARQYDGYPQYQNGVGLVRSLLDEWARLRRSPRLDRLSRRAITLVCGSRIAPILSKIAASIGGMTALDIEVVPVINTYFGPSVTVSGLLTATDVRRALAERELGDFVLLSRAMLDAAGDRFLDDETPAGLAAAVGRPVRFAHSLRELLRSVEVGEP